MIEQYGLFYRNLGRCPSAILTAFFESLSSFSVQPSASHTLGPTTMVVQNSKLDDNDTSNIYLSEELLVACDARIDEPSVPAKSASEIITGLINVYGIEGWNKLEGDFAVAHWNSREQELQLVRDSFGTRPLYYHYTPDLIIWSSNLAYLAAFLSAGTEIDDLYIADLLTGSHHLDRTPYKAIRAVEPGACLKITKDRETNYPYWDIRSHGEIVYSTDADYEHHFRTLFEQSVYRRLRNKPNALAELSGGMDSSSVVCVADDLVRRGLLECQIDTISCLFDGSPLANESRLIKLVEEQRNRLGYHVFESHFLEQTSGSNSIKPNWFSLLPDTTESIRNKLVTMGTETMLSGQGGDEVSMARYALGQEVSPLFMRFQLVSCYRSILKWAKAEGRSIGDVCLEALGSLLSQYVKPSYDMVAEASKLLRDLDSKFVERFRCDQLINVPEQYRSEKKSSLRHQYGNIHKAIWMCSQCYNREFFGVNMCHPYLDRNVVHFMLSIPTNQKRRPGKTKSIVRRALRTVVPKPIRQQKHKIGGPIQPFMKALRKNWLKINSELADAEIFRRGYADRAAFTKHLERTSHGIIDSSLLSHWIFLVLERWLQERRLHAKRINISTNLIMSN